MIRARGGRRSRATSRPSIVRSKTHCRTCSVCWESSRARILALDRFGSLLLRRDANAATHMRRGELIAACPYCIAEHTAAISSQADSLRRIGLVDLPAGRHSPRRIACLADFPPHTSSSASRHSESEPIAPHFSWPTSRAKYPIREARGDGRQIEARVLSETPSRAAGSIQRRRRNYTAETARNAVTLVVGHNENDVRRALGWHDPRRPVGRGVFGAFLDHSARRHRWRWALFPVQRHGGAGRTLHAIDLLGVGGRGR